MKKKLVKNIFLAEKFVMDRQTDIGFEVVREKNEINGQTDRQTLVSKLNEKSRFFIRFPSI